MANIMTNELENVIVEAIKRLDIEMFKEFSGHVTNYKNSKKLYFYEDLEVVFNKLRNSGDTELEPHFGHCGKCSTDQHGYLFVGNNSRNYFNILFDEDINSIIDIVECSDFKVKNKIINLKERIYINHYNDPKGDDYVPF